MSTMTQDQALQIVNNSKATKAELATAAQVLAKSQSEVQSEIAAMREEIAKLAKQRPGRGSGPRIPEAPESGTIRVLPGSVNQTTRNGRFAVIFDVICGLDRSSYGEEASVVVKGFRLDWGTFIMNGPAVQSRGSYDTKAFVNSAETETRRGRSTNRAQLALMKSLLVELQEQLQENLIEPQKVTDLERFLMAHANKAESASASAKEEEETDDLLNGMVG